MDDFVVYVEKFLTFFRKERSIGHRKSVKIIEGGGMGFVRLVCLFVFPLCFVCGDVSFQYRAIGDRKDVADLLRAKPKKRVLDVGYSANTWSSEFVTHFIDINRPENCSKIAFIGDINSVETWQAIEKDVKKNGLFDYCICSHTLEDIIHPVFVASMIVKYCKAGFIAVPSKFVEMKRQVEGPYRGYIHHRYIYNFEEGKLTGYPKLSFIEYDGRFDPVANQLSENNSELQVFWNDTFDLKIINDNYMGPNAVSVLKYYDGLLVNCKMHMRPIASEKRETPFR